MTTILIAMALILPRHSHRVLSIGRIGSHVLYRYPVNYDVGPPVPVHHPKGCWAIVSIRKARFWLFENKKLLYACAIATPAKGHPAELGDMVIEQTVFRPDWDPTPATRRMYARAGCPLPSGLIKGDSSKNELGIYKWEVGTDPIVFHGHLQPGNAGTRSTRGCPQFGDGDIYKITKRGMGVGSHIYVYY